MGSRSSSSNTQDILNVDRRNALENGIAVSGDGSKVNYSTSADWTQTTNLNDSRQWISNSGNTTNWQQYTQLNDSRVTRDSGNTTTNTTITTTDGGTVKMAAEATKEALQLASGGLQRALQLAEKAQTGALDYGKTVYDTALDAIGETGHSSERIIGIAVKEVASAWENAKAAEGGRNLGDMKYVWWAIGAALVVVAWRMGKR